MDLTDDEKDALMKTEEFQRFFDRTTRIIERALDEGPDIFTDYSGIDADDQERWVYRL
jgi:dynein intermediate chain